MSTITTESIADTIEGLEHLANSGIQSVYIDMAIAGMRRLQSSLEAEPVCYIDAEYAELLKSGHIESCSVYAEQGEGCITLFTVPPATVSVPDEKVKGDDFELDGPLSCYQAGKIDGWNECRAAMLQSFGNSEQLSSPVIPDGWVACSEWMPERGVDILACTISPIGGFEEIETAQWHGGMKGEQPVLITSADTIEPTHWMPLPAAPQQEA